MHRRDVPPRFRCPVRAPSRAAFAPLIATLLAAGAALAAAGPAPAQRVTFDAPPLVAARDVTPEEFAAVNPHERLVEAALPISSLLTEGREDRLDHYLYRIEGLHASFTVADHLPKTTLATSIVSAMNVENKREDGQSFGITVSGTYDRLARGEASGGVNKKVVSSVRYELLPPLELVAASGTIQRGGGVYFKLRPSPQTALEGAKEFTMVLRVSDGWRGDLVRVRCEAFARAAPAIPPLDWVGAAPEPTLRPCGEGDFLVALFAEGDPAARETAMQFVHAEQRLRATLAYRRRELQQVKYPSPLHRLGGAAGVVDPRLPAGWDEQLLLRADAAALAAVQSRLPREVRTTAHVYVQARASMLALAHPPLVALHAPESTAAVGRRTVEENAAAPWPERGGAPATDQDS